MFFTNYNPLTPEYVEEKAKAIGAAVGGGCGCLKGMKFDVKLEGQFAPAKLAYEIKDEMWNGQDQNYDRLFYMTDTDDSGAPCYRIPIYGGLPG